MVLGSIPGDREIHRFAPRRRVSGMQFALLACVILKALHVNGQEPSARVGQQATVAIVEVPVVAVGEDGQPVTDLRPAEFVVKDDGARQALIFATRVTSAAADPGNRSVDASSIIPPAPSQLRLQRNFAFVFDRTFNDGASLRAARTAADLFISDNLDPLDMAAVFSVDTGSGATLLINFAKDRGQLHDAIVSLGTTRAEARRPWDWMPTPTTWVSEATRCSNLSPVRLEG
ncbi:MAG: hypothetical protein HYX75_10245 [Acidobacteria bacterium]|nr:hypothetical protein [Acidobacteriota bacterium]